MFCVFCGGPAQGTVTLKCETCGRTHYLNSKISGSALVVHHDRYLVVRRASEPEKGKWDLPGGFCEYGEDPRETARRETFEESGLAVEIVRLLGVWMDEYREPDGSHWPTMNLQYEARLVDADRAPTADRLIDEYEVTALRWAPLELPPISMAFPKQQLGALAAFYETRENRRSGEP
jgi:8-oxo-dGTP diphosphatase